MSKWTEIKVGNKLVMLGLLFDTRKMTVGVPGKYMEEVLALLDDHRHPHRKSFTVNDIELLTGKLGRLGEGAPWVYHLMSHIYSTVATSLLQNSAFLVASSKEFRDLMRLSRSKTHDSLAEELNEINIAIRQVVQHQ